MPLALARAAAAASAGRAPVSAARRHAARSARGSVLVRDPLSTWGATASMGVRQLLDAVDHAERAKTGAHRTLWERLSCRTQALAPDLTAQELCRALFGFHRARYRDKSLLQAACDAVQVDQPGQDLAANDVVLLLKVLSKHDFAHVPTVDFLLGQCQERLATMTAADISHLLAATVRLGVSERLHSSGPYPDLLAKLFSAAQEQLATSYLPPADLTNLCVVAALLPPVQESSFFVAAVIARLKGKGAMVTPPKDMVRRLLSVKAFDEGLRRSEAPSCRGRGVQPVAEVLGPDGLAQVCQAVASGLSRRAAELDPLTSVAACEVFAQLLPQCALGSPWRPKVRGGKRDGTVLRPLLALVLQRLPGLSSELTARARAAAAALAESLEEPTLTELIVALSCEMARPGGT
mmetsp:Transcript_89959/g.262939  ORF Transcript_89959/g.262939 Transcript_89959/m.262939 type:complete len:407 (-) Transcript_89959:50-1270(-)